MSDFTVRNAIEAWDMDVLRPWITESPEIFSVLWRGISPGHGSVSDLEFWTKAQVGEVVRVGPGSGYACFTTLGASEAIEWAGSICPPTELPVLVCLLGATGRRVPDDYPDDYVWGEVLVLDTGFTVVSRGESPNARVVVCRAIT